MTDEAGPSPALPRRVVVRRELTGRDADSIVALHDRVYSTEYGLDARFTASVDWSVQAALARGWPRTSGAVWLVDHAGELNGSLALIDQDEGIGRVRWFVLAPALRGRGLGRRLVAEMLSEARAAGLQKLGLETFSRLTVASRIYRDAGFRLVYQRQTDVWGPPILYQGYERELR
jgi:GNAT superfamily N-acetyltransferase